MTIMKKITKTNSNAETPAELNIVGGLTDDELSEKYGFNQERSRSIAEALGIPYDNEESDY
jgi:hypothetical protein